MQEDTPPCFSRPLSAGVGPGAGQPDGGSQGAVATAHLPPAAAQSPAHRLNPFGYTPVSERIRLSPSLPAWVKALCREFSCQISPFLSLPVTLPGVARRVLSVARRRNPTRRTPSWQIHRAITSLIH
jgi:hypothetical protein